ncbi:hypothetical protein PCANC_21214 [Puccinia coronata f. sp. avenae]|uniref:Uncharacterized protein n=1 Tax=Puccinia coronata f. sp. avenae TaxID=200324 RepID=A0A2N5UGP8_9BASI|nr:hypothetical protein PCANC_21214 [Puccinia coronata f. sp. avenae]
MRQKLTQMLGSLAEMFNGTYMLQERQNQDDQTDNTQAEPEEKKAHQARAMQLGQLAIPFLKLAQLFYNKLSNTATSTLLLFKLHSEMRTTCFGVKTKCFQSHIKNLHGHLWTIYKTDNNMFHNISLLHGVTIQSGITLDQALLALAVHMVPLPPAVGLAVMQHNFKVLFFPLKN